MTLPTDPKARKAIPVYSGFVKYFPRGMAAVAELSLIANDQHNPGQPLHWDRNKSSDELDALMRHTLDEAMGETIDTDNVLHATKRAWRAMADLEKKLEKIAAAEAAALKLKPELPQLIESGDDFHHSDAVVRSYGPRPGCNCSSCKCERERGTVGVGLIT